MAVHALLHMPNALMYHVVVLVVSKCCTDVRGKWIPSTMMIVASLLSNSRSSLLSHQNGGELAERARDIKVLSISTAKGSQWIVFHNSFWRGISHPAPTPTMVPSMTRRHICSPMASRVTFSSTTSSFFCVTAAA